MKKKAGESIIFLRIDRGEIYFECFWRSYKKHGIQS